jgi:hypothetical protein
MVLGTQFTHGGDLVTVDQIDERQASNAALCASALSFDLIRAARQSSIFSRVNYAAAGGN